MRPRSTPANDDGDAESDKSEPKPLKVRHSPNPHFVGGVSRLLYDLIRPQEQRRRDGEAERFRGLHIDHKLELPRLLDRQVAGLGALEDLVYKVAAWRKLSPCRSDRSS
jgi:hypothetical protein